MKNIVENQDIKTDKPLPMSYEALKAERDALADKCDRLEYNLGNAIVGEQEALQRVNGLAVENAAMRGVIDAAIGVANNSSGIAGWHLTGEIADWDEILPELNIETPATDAALAAIQAQGVEKAAAALDALSAQSASATTQANFRAAAVYLRAAVLPAIGEDK